MARKAADYITFNCDEISEGFEITYKGHTAFVDYRNDNGDETVAVPDVWDGDGNEYPDIADALQLLLN